MFSYILQVVLFQFLFLTVYEILLKKETFFTWNRWYLLATSVISLMLPLIQIEALAFLWPTGPISEKSTVWLPEVIIGETSAAAIPETVPIWANLNWWFLGYGVGVTASLYIFFRKYQNLSRLYRFKSIASEGDFKIIEVPNSTIACTFFKTVFLGDQLSEAEKQQILFHELVHVKQKHSLDLVFFEVLKFFLWFNPFIYIYQNRMATLHEYIADSEVVQTTEKRVYYEQLLNSAFNTSNISFINQFFSHSLTRLTAFGKTLVIGSSGKEVKKRIIMLQKSRSKTTAKIKYLALLPLTLLMLSFVAFSGTGDQILPVSPEVVEEKTESEISQQANVQEPPMPFAVVDQVPVFPGCNQEEYEARRECLVEKIKDHVNRNFNLGAVKPYMAPDINRIIVQFKIDANGKVTDVRSRMVTPGPDKDAKEFMEGEANRVVATLPQMEPAKHDGKVVGVMYSLPIQFFTPDEEGQ